MYDVTSSHFFRGGLRKNTLCDCLSPCRFHDFTLWQVKFHFWLYVFNHLSIITPYISEKNCCPNFQILILFKEGMMAPKLLPANNRYQTVIPWSEKLRWWILSDLYLGWMWWCELSSLSTETSRNTWSCGRDGATSLHVTWAVSKFVEHGGVQGGGVRYQVSVNF